MALVVDLPGDLPCKLIKWKVKAGSRVSQSTILALYTPTGHDNIKKLKCNHVGTVTEIVATEGQTVQPRDPVIKIEGCTHPTLMKDMCADCGADLREEHGLAGERKANTSATVAMVHNIPELIVSEEQAMEIGQKDESRLLSNRKLVLLVDLDQTLLHTTNDNIPANLKDVEHFRLWHGRWTWYHTKFRPATREFLERMSELYELHICTFGVRMYAHTIAKLLDPKGKLFSHRILSRDECFSNNSKTANLKALFPCGDSMVCIIDDRKDVWNFAPNLIQVKPYLFFDGTADINTPPGLATKQQDGNAKAPRHNVKIIKVPRKKPENESPVESDAQVGNKSPNSSQESEGGTKDNDGSRVNSTNDAETDKPVSKPVENGDKTVEYNNGLDTTSEANSDGQQSQIAENRDISQDTIKEVVETKMEIDTVSSSDTKPDILASASESMSNEAKSSESPTEKEILSQSNPTSESDNKIDSTASEKEANPQTEAMQAEVTPQAEVLSEALSGTKNVSQTETKQDSEALAESESVTSSQNVQESEVESPQNNAEMQDTAVDAESKKKDDSEIVIKTQDANLETGSLSKSQTKNDSPSDPVTDKGSQDENLSSDNQAVDSSSSLDRPFGHLKGESSTIDSQNNPTQGQAYCLENEARIISMEHPTEAYACGELDDLIVSSDSSDNEMETEMHEDELNIVKNVAFSDTAVSSSSDAPPTKTSPEGNLSSQSDADNVNKSQTSEGDQSTQSSRPEKEEGEVTSEEDRETGDSQKNPGNLEEFDEIIEWEDSDDYLIYLEDVLRRIHEVYYKMFDEGKEKNDEKIPDLKSIVPYVKKKVLKGANLLFSGVIPTNQQLEKSRAYHTAIALGAKIHTQFVPRTADNQEEATTHLVAARRGTAKVHQVKKHKRVKIVNPDWLWTCSERWEWVDERIFPLPAESSQFPFVDSPDPSKQSKKSSANKTGIPKTESKGDLTAEGTTSGTPASIKERKFSESYNPLFAFSTTDIKEMDKEVEQIFDESESEDSEEELRRIVLGFGRKRPRESSSEESLAGEYPKGWGKKHRKRTCADTCEEDKNSTDEDLDDENEDRRKLIENPSSLVKFSEGSSDSKSSVDSIGSLDDEMAAALEREFLSY